MVTYLEYQNYLPLMELAYINLRPRDMLIISSGCKKTKLGLPSQKKLKSAGKSFICLNFEF